ncbi:MAG: circadian clock protein KaiA [Cyanobacteria bacterium P01_D01_bin.105]
MSAQFLLGVFVPTEALAQALQQQLSQRSFAVNWSQSASEFTDWIIRNRHLVDCLILQPSAEGMSALEKLKQQNVLLPTLTVGDAVVEDDMDVARSYHAAVAVLEPSLLGDDVDIAIHRAVEQYLQLPSTVSKSSAEDGTDDDDRSFVLSLQQQRLTQKLKERLGYVGVYYKRNQRNFLRNMGASEQQAFLDKLRQDYRLIILNYFTPDTGINQQIDDFVNVAFFADMSVPKIVEIHMELIDDFSKQLQLEGRNDDILADYRLTLIDVIAHLCEMYRRALPKEADA